MAFAISGSGYIECPSTIKANAEEVSHNRMAATVKRVVDRNPALFLDSEDGHKLQSLIYNLEVLCEVHNQGC